MAWAHDARSYPEYNHFLLGELRPRLGDGKRVGIIGTGATAVQTIQEIAKTVGRLTVLQRAPNWCAPLHNGKISDADMDEMGARGKPDDPSALGAFCWRPRSAHSGRVGGRDRR
jgi:hypothetical protein